MPKTFHAHNVYETINRPYSGEKCCDLVLKFNTCFGVKYFKLSIQIARRIQHALFMKGRRKREEIKVTYGINRYSSEKVVHYYKMSCFKVLSAVLPLYKEYGSR